jgi:hypothetical protein
LRPDGACGSSPAGASAAQKRIATTSPALSERVGMRVEGRRAAARWYAMTRGCYHFREAAAVMPIGYRKAAADVI